jgi:hypothetical protein
LAVLLVARLAAAADWGHSFPTAATGALLPNNRPGVIVVAAGDGAAVAAASVIMSLRESGRARLVMDPSNLRNVSGLADQDIVRQAKYLPVEIVVVVRVFPGATANAETAVITLYNKQLKTLGAASTQRGVPLKTPEWASGQGVSSAAASAVDQVVDERRNNKPKPPQEDVDDEEPAPPPPQYGQPPQYGAPPPPYGYGAPPPIPVAPVLSPAEQQYQDEKIGFYRFNSFYDSSSPTWGAPFQGPGRASLDHESFYRIVGRKDYAETRRRRNNARIGLLAAGVPALLVGTGLWLGDIGDAYSHQFCLEQDMSGKCLKSEARINWGVTGAGLGLFVFGLVATIAGGSMDRNPTTDEENWRMAGEHDRKLRQRLGLPPIDDPDLPSEAKRVPLSIAPHVSPTGGGLTATVRF